MTANTPGMVSRRRSALYASLSALAVTAGLMAPSSSAAAAPTVTDGCVRSVADPDTAGPVDICYTMFKPAGASTTKRVPVLLQGHGWGGSRTTDPAVFARYLDAGYGVISFDQRGFGDSGGKAQTMDPAVEGVDVQRLIDLAAKQTWVQQDRPGDPRIGAIGGSYGGGYQYVGAFSEIAKSGKTRFDALAPEYTWNDINDALAPSGVARSEWLSVLVGIAQPSQALPQHVNQSFVEGAATGQYPDGLKAFYANNGPAFHIAKGRRIDVPVLVRQGISDNLFNLNQALKNLSGLTPAARARSVVVGFHGGHALPAVLPRGSHAGEPVALGDDGTDPCSPALQGGTGDFTSLQLRFFDVHLKGRKGVVPGEGRYALVTPDGGCLQTAELGTPKAFTAGDVTTPVAVTGAPQFVPLAQGPLTVAGTPYVRAKVTTLTPEARAFFALAVGTSPADAQIVDSNVLPLREPAAVSGKARRVELPAVAVTVPAGQQLFLAVTPFAEMFGLHASRVPGLLTLDDAVVDVPLLKG
ncbi:MAG: X-Pro dipeptidyl-peptidase family [Frankiales bacterium]|nr:X-Pro dipeptidyl-peptidase family [Frankiales bacterium]